MKLEAVFEKLITQRAEAIFGEIQGMQREIYGGHKMERESSCHANDISEHKLIVGPL